MMIVKNKALAGIVLMACAGLVGCGASPSKPASSAAVKQVTEQGHSHEGWWCDEHGVPEEVCAQCNTKLAGDFKAKGDWCKEHDRPESQCFVCHPEKKAEFAALYEAKYGKNPPLLK
jgi:cobalt-zinc-cadmium efflux system membrane fusion protein